MASAWKWVAATLPVACGAFCLGTMFALACAEAADATLTLDTAASAIVPAPRLMQSVGVNIGNSAWGWPKNDMPAEAPAVIAASGIGWVRLTLPWASVQWQAQNPEDWSRYDVIVDALRAKNLKVLLDIKSTPCWARADQSLPCRNPDYLGYAPNAQLWQKFIEDAVKHFKGRVSYWEIWNEPNYDAWFHDPGVPDNAEQRFIDFRSEILIPGAQAVHAADPDAKVVGPTITAAAYLLTPAEFAQRLKDTLGGDAAKLVDVVDIHCYPPGGPLVYGSAARYVMAGLGIGSKPLWLTEMGQLQPKSQAEYISGVLDRNFSSRKIIFNRIFVFALLDNAGGGATGRYGLVNEDWSPRPAYLALQKLAAGSNIQ